MNLKLLYTRTFLRKKDFEYLNFIKSMKVQPARLTTCVKRVSDTFSYIFKLAQKLRTAQSGNVMNKASMAIYGADQVWHVQLLYSG